MPQETVGWDLKDLTVEPSTSFKPVFRPLRQSDSSVAMVKLTAASTSLRLWIGCTWLVWGIFMSTNLHILCDRMLDETPLGIVVFLLSIRDHSTSLTVTLAVVSVLFLVRWLALKGMERIPS